MKYHIRIKDGQYVLGLTKNVEGFKTITELVRFIVDNPDKFNDWSGREIEIIIRETVEKVV